MQMTRNSITVTIAFVCPLTEKFWLGTASNARSAMYGQGYLGYIPAKTVLTNIFCAQKFDFRVPFSMNRTIQDPSSLLLLQKIFHTAFRKM